MNGYPIVLTGLQGRRCVVVGGGCVAARKARSLVEAGARPLVISPELDADLETMAAAGQVEVWRRAYRAGDLAGAFLAIAATGDRAANVAVAEEAARGNIPANVVDDPELCTFIAPAVLRRGDLLVAISTGGQSPALARHLRDRLEQAIDPAYGDLLALLGALRPRLLRQVAPARQPAAWQRLLDGELLTCLRNEGIDAARRRAEEILAGMAGLDPGLETPQPPGEAGPREPTLPEGGQGQPPLCNSPTLG